MVHQHWIEEEVVVEVEEGSSSMRMRSPSSTGVLPSEPLEEEEAMEAPHLGTLVGEEVEADAFR